MYGNFIMNLAVYAASAAPIGPQVGKLRQTDEAPFRYMYGAHNRGTAPAEYAIFSCAVSEPFATRHDNGRLTVYVANGQKAMPIGTDLRDEDVPKLLAALPKVNWAQA